MNPRNFFAELKRRNVYKVAIAYTVVAWLLIQIATQVFPFFEILNWGASCKLAIAPLVFSCRCARKEISFPRGQTWRNHGMHMFTRKTEPAAPAKESARPSVVPGPSNRTFMPMQSGALLSRGVSIKGSVKFLNELLIDGEVKGTIDSTGTLTIGEHARICGEIRTKSVKVRGTVEGNIFATERCELQAGCSLRGDIEAPRMVVNENATFLGSAKVGTRKSLPA